MKRTTVLAGLLILSAGCARGPLEAVCPNIAAGGLAVSEVRGNQSGLDTWGQWIEIYNSTAVPVEAGGLVLRLTDADPVTCTASGPTCDCAPGQDGKSSHCGCGFDQDCAADGVCEGGACHEFTDIMLLDSSLVIEPGAYLVAGRFPAYDLPAHVDYGYEAQFGSSLYDAARLQLLTCDALGNDVLVDEVAWTDLPSKGSWAFDGARTLTAAANDDQSAWCVDDTMPAPGDGTAQGAPGTPGEVNPSCK
ncbi:MAG: hypothetical protein GXP54_05130 [Deltaproteobacteria bacterium]|nr:hypothetical protein [Deltaproteobacteria bacterium]